MDRITHDSDRAAFKAAFAELRKAGWTARMNFSCCSSCGWYELNAKLEEKGVAEDDRKIVFWNRQSDDSFNTGRSWHYKGERTDELHKPLYLQHGGPAFEVVGVLVKHGLDAYWSGDQGDCIEVRPKDETPALLKRQAS